MANPKPLTEFQQSYHWRNKNCGPWASDWVKEKLPGLKVSDGKQSAEITEVINVSGDCDLGQRKGKLLTIYDMQFDAKWKGTTASGEEAEGKVSCPEFSHEQVDGLEDYQFHWSAEAKEGEELLPYVRKGLVPALEEKLNGFRAELLAAHGMFVDSLAGSAPASGAATPARSMQTYSPAPPGEVREKAPAPKKTEKVNATASIEASVDLRASADDCWSLLTDPARVPMWSRSQAKIAPTPGAEFELFGGAVSGKITEAQPPTKLVQTWNTKSPGWPAEHYGTMTITLKQGSDSTNVTFKLEGVPAGKEDDIERAIDQFYVQGLKQTGLVQSARSKSWLVKKDVSSKTTGATATGTRRRKRSKQAAAGPEGVLFGLETPQLVGIGAAAALAAVFAGLVASSFK